MAASRVIQKSLTQDILQCSLCLENLDRPKALQCLHTFCLNCLQEYISQQKYTKKISCPICRKCTVIKQGVEDLTTNFHLISLQDALDKLQHIPNAGDGPSYCCHHIEYQLSIYCLSCSEAICCICEDEKHTDHNTSSVSKAVLHLLSEISDKMTILDRQNTNDSVLQKNIFQHNAHLIFHKSDIIAKLSEVKDQLIADVNQWFDNSVQELCFLYDQERTNMTSTATKLKARTTKVEELTDFLDNSKTHIKDANLLKSALLYKEMAVSINNKEEDEPKRTKLTEFKYISFDTDSFVVQHRESLEDRFNWKWNKLKPHKFVIDKLPVLPKFQVMVSIYLGNDTCGYAFIINVRGSPLRRRAYMGFKDKIADSMFHFEEDGNLVAIGEDRLKRADDGGDLLPIVDTVHGVRHVLNQSECIQDASIKGVNNAEYTLKNVCVAVFSFINRHMLENVLKLQGDCSLDESQIQWILTTPHTYSSTQNEFINEAFFEAGLVTDEDRDRVLLIDEEDAAVSYLLQPIGGKPPILKEIADHGVQMILVNCEGGLLSVSEFLTDQNNLFCKTQNKSTYEWVGSHLQNDIKYHLNELRGTDTQELSRAKLTHVQKQLVLWSPGDNIEVSLTGEVDESADDSDDNCIVLPSQTIENLLKAIISDIVWIILQLEPTDGIYPKIYCVTGGYMRYKFIHAETKTELSKLGRAYVSEYAELDIMFGALMFGHDPRRLKLETEVNIGESVRNDSTHQAVGNENVIDSDNNRDTVYL